ncbi:cytochrome P450 1B1 [Apophysomyces ossiformis]|uniref:Cytochrome P450 1B1 n=1 Tax=Apophysomyces ossiformis TaxID=679940 RepID=A0A8H7BX96_9FUNG|nr:cytochrome P450 1B1 [Apophysomyces ossiformis]
MSLTSYTSSIHSALLSSKLDKDASRTAVAIVGLGVAAAALLKTWKSVSSSTLDLPGPTGWPIVGNLFQLGENWSETFARWSRTFGPVYKVRLGNRDVVVVNTVEAAKALFLDQGSAYTSRPYFYTFHGVFTNHAAPTIGTSFWNDSTRRKRRAVATAMNKPKVQSYVPIIEAEAHALVKEIYIMSQAGQIPLDPYTYFQRLALNTSLEVHFGTRLGDVEDSLFKEVAEVTAKVAGVRAVTGSLQDYLPILRYIPNNKASAQAANYGRRRKVFMDHFLDEVIERVKRNEDIPCIMSSILRDPENDLSRPEMDSISASMVSAGLDTFANTMIWSVGLLAARPDIQEKAQKAIEAVYGDRAPDPYEEKVEYISLPRATTADSIWNGVVIPSGSTIFMNAWALNFDDTVFDSPWEFRPERYMKDDLQGTNLFAFGLGRRMCPGVHLASREMYVSFLYVLYYFNIRKSDDVQEQDYDIHPLTGVHKAQAFSVAPKRFKVVFEPRNQEHFKQNILERSV